MLKELIILPELAIGTIGLLAVLCAVLCPARVRLIACATIVSLFVILLSLSQLASHEASAFHGSFESDFKTVFCKSMILLFTIMTAIMYYSLCKISNTIIKIEFLALLIFSTVGAFIAVSARDLLVLFCALELQALTGYAMAAMDNNLKSAEGAVKYFILGALMSCISLVGISFLYGFTGSLKFQAIFEALNNPTQNIAIIIGVVLMLSNILFKLSAVPLHIWTPDVYEGAPICAVTYFATSQKISTLFVLINVVTLMVGDYVQISVLLLKIVAILSMVIGVLGAIRQNSLKRLMAYSTILNVGYALIGVALHNVQGMIAAVTYIITYIAAVLGFFACLIALLGERATIATFDDLSGIASERKTIAAVISVLAFSMIGLPPLAGFFGKYYIFYNAIQQGQWLLAGVGVTCSVIASFYYLKIVKSMYFIDATTMINKIPTDRGLLFVTFLVIGFVLFFSIG